MPLCSDLFNVFDLRILIPDRTAVGGDQGSSPTVRAEGLSAYYEPGGERLFRDETRREEIISGTFWITGFDADGVLIPVEEGDFVEWTDWKGTLSKQQEIVHVRPWIDGATLDHLVLEIGR